MGSPERSLILPSASCTIKSAAARSQSWLLPPAKAASSTPSATRHSRSASEPIRGCSLISLRRRSSRSTSGFGPATREKSSVDPAAARTGTAVERRALPAGGEEELIASPARTPPRARGDGILDQRDADAPFVMAAEIVAGAVDGIDDPGPPPRQPHLVVGALLGQPAIIRRRRAQARFQEIVDGNVGFRHRRGRALGPLPQLGAEHRLREAPASRTVSCSSAASRARMVSSVASRQRPPSVNPSMRTVGALMP